MKMKILKLFELLLNVPFLLPIMTGLKHLNELENNKLAHGF